MLVHFWIPILIVMQKINVFRCIVYNTFQSYLSNMSCTQICKCNFKCLITKIRASIALFKPFVPGLLSFLDWSPPGHLCLIFQKQISNTNSTFFSLYTKYESIVGSVVECSPATRAARVRFPDDAVCVLIFKKRFFLYPFKVQASISLISGFDSLTMQ